MKQTSRIEREKSLSIFLFMISFEWEMRYNLIIFSQVTHVLSSVWCKCLVQTHTRTEKSWNFLLELEHESPWLFLCMKLISSDEFAKLISTVLKNQQKNMLKRKMRGDKKQWKKARQMFELCNLFYFKYEIMFWILNTQSCQPLGWKRIIRQEIYSFLWKTEGRRQTFHKCFLFIR